MSHAETFWEEPEISEKTEWKDFAQAEISTIENLHHERSRVLQEIEFKERSLF